MRITPAVLAGILTLGLASPVFAQQPVRRLQVGIGLGVALENTEVASEPLATPSLDARVAWRVGERLSFGALFGFYGMNDEGPLESDLVVSGFDVIRISTPDVAQVRTWNGFIQWTSRSGLFIRPGGGFGWHSYASYTPFPESGPPERYLPHESSEMGLIFTLAVGKEYRRSSRVGIAIEGFFVGSTGEDSSGQRTIVGVNLVPLVRW
jgi:hypothetical protein